MKNAYTYVSRISSHYTGDDCVQLMIGYKTNMTMFNKDRIQYHYVPDSSINVNEYLNDDRRFQFPYHDIPEHVERKLGRKYKFTNQLLDYEENYVTVSGNAIIERKAILDKDEALVINNILPIKRRTLNVDRVGLENLFKKDKDTYILRIDGSASKEDYSFDIASEDDIVSWAKKRLSSDLDDFKYFLDSSTFGHDWMTKNMNNIIENIDIETIPEIPLEVHDGMVIVKLKEGNINIQVVRKVIFLAPNQYKVIIMDLPMMDKMVTIDALRMLNITDIREPKISRCLNRNVDSELIEGNKRLLRRLK